MLQFSEPQVHCYDIYSFRVIHYYQSFVVLSFYLEAKIDSLFIFWEQLTVL